MTAVIPKVVIHKKKNPVQSRPGTAGKVAIIGAFDSEATDPASYASLDEAYDALGTDTTFNGCACLDKIFVGASSILAVNITTWSGSGSSKTPTKTLTTANLTAALAKIKGEDFDILFVADNIEDTAFPIITAFLEETFSMKFPAGYIAGITRANTSAYTTSAGLAGDQCYGIITQQLTVGGTTYSLVESAAYYCGVIAGMGVGNTMTNKIIPNVTGITPELSFETAGAGKAYLEAGITTVKCQNRNAGNYIVVNSEQPNGLDLYVNRTRDYVVKEMSLHQFLGKRNREPTLNEIKQELFRVKNQCVNVLDLLKDIEYHVEKKTASCVDVHITKLLFDGLITTIDVYVSLEVE